MVMNDPAPGRFAACALKSLLLDPALDAQLRTYQPPAVLHEAGSPALDLYIVHQGQIRLYQPGPRGVDRLVEIYGPGHWFGSEALAGRAIHAHRAVVVSTARVGIVAAHKLLEQLPRRPLAAVELVGQLARKVQLAREDAGRLVFDDCGDRLLKTLVRFSDSAAATAIPGGVELHITHMQLAQAVGVARETISLALTQLRRRSLLQTGRNRLTYNPDLLRQSLCRDHQRSILREAAV